MLFPRLCCYPLLICAIVLQTATHAFTVYPSRTHCPRILQPTALFQADEESSIPLESASPYEPGSHEELVYALGVNLARQLGDVRPLVENSAELTSVAQGLLDTVIGRLDDEGQRELLQRRGGDLNNLITERA